MRMIFLLFKIKKRSWIKIKIEYVSQDDKLLIKPDTPNEIDILTSFATEKISGFIHVRGLVIAKIIEGNKLSKTE